MSSTSCLIWNVSPIMFSIGPLTIRWYGFMFSMVIFVGYFFLKWQFNRAKIPLENLDRLVLYLLAGLFFGAYFGHRIFYEWDRFISDPLSTINITKGIYGLSSHGAAIGLMTAAFLYHRKTKMRYLEILDRFSFTTAVGATLVRLGNLFNSEIVGRQTDVPWAFCFPRHDGSNIPRHPSQVYEICMGIAVLVLLLIVDRKAGGEKRPLGLLSGVFFISYFSFRFIVEFFKEYQALPTGFPLTMGQFLSIPFPIAGICLIVWALKKRLPASDK